MYVVNAADTAAERDIFASVREFNADEKCLLVSFGITTGEFCLFDVLNSSK